MSDRFFRFLLDHKKAPKAPQTHTRFDGSCVGTLSIESKDMPLLRSLLLEYVDGKADSQLGNRNGLNAISEKVPSGAAIRFFVDLDFDISQVESLSVDEVITIMRQYIDVCIETVRKTFGAPLSRNKVSRRGYYKVHVHFPDLIVDKKTAIILCNSFRAAMQQLPLYQEKVLDQTVYNTGLRILYCHKGALVKKTDNEAKRVAEHEAVFGKGSYEHVYEVIDLKTFEKIVPRSLQDLEDTSIIPSEGQVLTELPPGFLQQSAAADLVKPRKRRRTKLNASGTGNNTVENTNFNNNSDTLTSLPDPGLNTEVPSILRNYIETAFAIILNGKMKTYAQTESVVLSTSNQQLCPFVKRSHQGNNVYIYLDAHGADLRCYDSDCEGQTHNFIPSANFPADVARELQDLFSTTQMVSSRLAQVENAVQEFSANSRGRVKNLTLCPVMEEVSYSNHRVTIPCSNQQHCPIHDRVHDTATCWIDVGLQGYMELRCSIDPHLFFPNPPFMLQNVNNFFQQVNVNVNVLPSREDSGFQKYRNLVLQACANAGVKKDRDGNLYRRVRPELSYAYGKFTTIREFVQDTLRDNADALEDPNSIDKMTKLLTDQRTSSCDFIQKDRHLLGFLNGVLNIVSCEFTPSENVNDDFVVRKYFDRIFDPEDLDTPHFDRLLRLQMPTDEGYNIMLTLIGRLFFWIGERDNWQVMTYVMSDQAGTGKSLLIDTVKAMFSEVGAISSNFEKKFGLSSLVNKEVVITDDLPRNIQEVLDQQLFQTMVSGGVLNVPIKNSTAPSVDWKVQQLYGCNWHLGYIDKGQISRRVATIPFDKTVAEVDTTLKASILTELPKIMHKCLRAYRDALERHGSASFWSFCPQELLETKDDMRATCNPLYTFLRDSPQVLYEEGARTDLKDLTRAFSAYMKKDVKKLDRVTFSQVNPEYVIEFVKLCKACLSAKGKGCCPAYLHGNRTTAQYVHNLRLL